MSSFLDAIGQAPAATGAASTTVHVITSPVSACTTSGVTVTFTCGICAPQARNNLVLPGCPGVLT